MELLINENVSSSGIVEIKKQPFFSVIISTYNRANTIIRALNSLLEQTEKDWEAIIVDDGSTDNTFFKLKDFLVKYDTIKYIKQENCGAAASKNKGIQNATGLYITFLDSDDEYETDHLASRKKMIFFNPNLEFISGGLKIIGSPFVPDRFNLTQQIHINNCEIGGTFFILRDLFLSLKGFNDILLGEDADLFDRVLKAGRKMLKTDLQTYIYHRETEGSVTNLFFKKNNDI